MRNNKFKIWDVRNQSWLEDMSRTEYFLTRDGLIFSYYNDGSGGYDCDYLDEEQYKVVFYTGLNDKNGNEIYELDVLSLSDDNYKVWYSERMGSYLIGGLNNEWDSLISDYRTGEMEILGTSLNKTLL